MIKGTKPIIENYKYLKIKFTSTLEEVKVAQQDVYKFLKRFRCHCYDFLFAVHTKKSLQV